MAATRVALGRLGVGVVMSHVLVGRIGRRGGRRVLMVVEGRRLWLGCLLLVRVVALLLAAGPIRSPPWYQNVLRFKLMKRRKGPRFKGIPSGGFFLNHNSRNRTMLRYGREWQKDFLGISTCLP